MQLLSYTLYANKLWLLKYKLFKGIKFRIWFRIIFHKDFFCTKWVFRIKYDSCRAISKCKAWVHRNILSCGIIFNNLDYIISCCLSTLGYPAGGCQWYAPQWNSSWRNIHLTTCRLCGYITSSSCLQDRESFLLSETSSKSLVQHSMIYYSIERIQQFKSRYITILQK